MNPRVRCAVALLAMVICLPPNVEAGPFRDLFRKVKRTFHRSKPKARSHPTVDRRADDTPPRTANDTPPRDSIAENPTTAGPPNERNTRAARAARAKVLPDDIPYGTPVPGKKGLVVSPFAPDSGYVDVRDFAPGSQVRDPFTGKIFLTP